MNCRNVSLILAAGAVLLLGGCETYYSLRRDIGIDQELPAQSQSQSQSQSRPQRMAAAPRTAPATAPASPSAPAPAMMTVPRADAAPAASMQTVPMQTAPMQATAMPAPIAPAPPAAAGNGIAQASWAAQRTANLSQQNQTLPFGAPEPKVEPKAEPKPEPKAGPAAAAASKPSASAPATKPAAPATGTMPAAVAASAAGSGLWRAHLASHRTEQAAISEWQERLKADPKRYEGLDPLVIWTDVPSRGAFARLTVGAYAGKKEADAVCARLRTSRSYCGAIRE